MKPSKRNLKRLCDEKKLIALKRDSCSDHKIQGFIITFSTDLVLVSIITDFHPDGLKLIRIQDIDEITLYKTETFQLSLLIEEGIFDRIDFDYQPPIDSYQSFLLSLPENEIVIVEDEISDDPIFLIGTVALIEPEQVNIRYFSGAANWDLDHSTIDFDEITSVQIQSNYTLFYSRHFKRTGEF